MLAESSVGMSQQLCNMKYLDRTNHDFKEISDPPTDKNDSFFPPMTLDDYLSAFRL